MTVDEIGMNDERLEKAIEELRSAGRYIDALELARKSRARRIDDPETKCYLVADADRLVRTLERLSALPDARQREFTEIDRLVPAIRELLGKAQYSAGLEIAERVLAAQRRFLGPEHCEVSTVLNDKARILQHMGEFGRAESLYRESLEMRRRLLGDAHPDVAESLHNVAAVLMALGNYLAAEPLYREALASFRGLLGEQHRAVALTLISLARLHQFKGDYASAEPLFREALAMQRRLRGKKHIEVALCISALARLLQARGDHARAEPLFKESLDMRREALGEEHRFIALGLNDLAGLLQAQGDSVSAEPLLRESLAMSRKLMGEQHRDVALSLDNLAIVLESQGNYIAAEPLRRQSLAIFSKLVVRVHPDVAASLGGLAKLLHARGKLAEAEVLYGDSLTILRELVQKEHRVLVSVLSNLAQLLQARGDMAGAERLYNEAATIFEAARLRAGLGFERATFTRSPYSLLAAARNTLGDGKGAWIAVEKDHGRVLADLLLRSEQRALSQEELGREATLRKALGRLERQIAALGETGGGGERGDVDDVLEDLQRQLLATEAEWSAFVLETAERYPISEGQSYDLNRIQAALSQDQAVVGWLDPDADRLNLDVPIWGYVIRSEGPVLWEELTSEVGSSSSESGASTPGELYRREVARRPILIGEDLERAKDLWRERFHSLSKHLNGIRGLIVVPSRSMLGIPVEAVPMEGDGVLLGEEFSISYAPSSTIYAWLAEHSLDSRRPNGAQRCLAIGDPPYRSEHLRELSDSENTGEPRTTRPIPPGRSQTSAPREQDQGDDQDSQLSSSALSGNSEALSSLKRLPASRSEAQVVTKLHGPSSRVLLGPEATEMELVRMADSGELGQYDTLHFATHALVDDERPEESALILSQVDLPDPLGAALAGARVFEGKITGKEIVRDWSLSADLVTLSACGTGLGRRIPGEGYVGLAHAFFQAGARSLLVSLWRVEDTSTSLLMKRFYENRLGHHSRLSDEETDGPTMPTVRMSKASALQEAKRWLRNWEDSGGNRPYAHPHFWAGFILIGDRA